MTTRLFKVCLTGMCFSTLFTALRSEDSPGTRALPKVQSQAVTTGLGLAVTGAADKAASQQFKSEYEYSLERARYLRKTKQYAEAMDEYKVAIGLNPRIAAAWNERGVISYAMEDYAGALRDFTKATEIQPKNCSMRANLAFALFRTGKCEEAIQAATQAVRLNPLNLAAAEALEFAKIEKLKREFVTVNKLNKNHVQTFYARAQTATDPRDQISNLRVAVALSYPRLLSERMVDSLHAQAARLERRGQGVESLEHLTAALVYAGENRQGSVEARAYQRRLELLVTMDRLDDAFKDALALATKHPSRVKLDELVKPWVIRKDWKKLIAFDTCIVTAPHSPIDTRRTYLLRRADHYESAGDYRKALEDYKSLVILHGTPSSYRLLAAYYVRRGELEKALVESEIAISRANGNAFELAHSYQLRGTIREAKGDMHVAQADYQSALDAMPAMDDAIRGKQRVARSLEDAGESNSLDELKQSFSDFESLLSTSK